MQTTKRLTYIDCLRGFSMIFVVYGHILHFGMATLTPSEISEFITTFRMPMFFFISGLVTYKAMFEWNVTNLYKIEIKKIRGQLLPTIVVLSIFLIIKGLDFSTALFSLNKQGYWFTFASFQIFTIFSLLCVLCHYAFKRLHIPTWGGG